MNREEAISILEAARKTMFLPKSKEYISDLGYALDMAIKALEQEPSNDMVSHEVFDEYGNYKYPSDFELTEPNTATSMPCGDAISRQAALDCFTATKLKKFDFILYARKKIKKLPPVNPQNCDKCEVGNPCLYCRHEFEPQERSDKCSKCEYYINPDYTRCKECGAERSDKE